MEKHLTKQKIREIRKNIPITKRCVYLNHGSGMVLLKQAVDAVNKYHQEQAKYGFLKVEEWIKEIDKTREAVAKFIGAEKDELSFTKNTTEGVNIIANAIPWKAGDNIILNTLEFPANTLPYVKQKEKGVKIKIVKEKNGKILLEDIKKTIDKKTKLVAVSHVSAENGFKHNLDKLGGICKENGVFLAVDAVQSLGAVKVNVKNVDFLASGCMKWLMAPFGIGIFYCKKSLYHKLNPAYVGWLGVEKPFDYKLFDYKLAKTGKRFEDGGWNIPGIYGLKASIDFFSKIGIENIEERMYKLTDYLIAGLQKIGFELYTPMEKEYRSGIVTIRNRKAVKIKKILFKNKIIVSARQDKLRISPHFYNTFEEIDALLKILSKFR